VNDEFERISKERSWPNVKILYRPSPGETEETTKTLSQDSQSPDRYLKPGPSEYEAEMLMG
jgi:hypothetical protein